MRNDIYVVQNNREEGKQLEQWCKELGLPISKNQFGFTSTNKDDDDNWNCFCWLTSYKAFCATDEKMEWGHYYELQ